MSSQWSTTTEKSSLGIGIRARVWTNVGAFAKKSSLGIEVLSRDRREIRKIDRWVIGSVRVWTNVGAWVAVD